MRSCSRASSIKISPTPASTSLVDTGRAHPLRFDDAGHGDDLVTTHHEGPSFAVGARDLGVDEHILDLLPAALQPVARPPSPYLKPWQPRLDPPAAPLDGAVEIDGAALGPEPFVRAHRLDAAAEIDALRPRRRGEQLRKRRRHRLAA